MMALALKHLGIESGFEIEKAVAHFFIHSLDLGPAARPSLLIFGTQLVG